MPEAHYGFKPSPDVRTFGQMAAHVADDQYNRCAPAKGETRKAAYTEIEDTLSKKADLIARTDASGAEMVKSGKRRSRFSMLNWNLWHTWEHYEGAAVYVRLKGPVPPTSERKQTK